jgi:hypothetical protein
MAKVSRNIFGLLELFLAKAGLDSHFKARG